MVAFSDDSSIADFTRWTMGSFGLMTWPKIYVLVLVCSVLFALSFLLGKNLNALRMGEAYAVTMGVNTKALRVAIILISGLLTAVVTAFAGPVSFIGMSVPHICRMILRTDDSRALIPSCILCGGIFGVGCDLISRTIIAPNELAIGTVTSYVGVPIVLYLLMKKKPARMISVGKRPVMEQLKLKQVDIGYGGQPLIRNIDLSFLQGKMTWHFGFQRSGQNDAVEDHRPDYQADRRGNQSERREC